MTDVPPGNVLHSYASPGQVIVVSAESQERVAIPVDSVCLLSDHERSLLRTTGSPAWYAAEPVREELTRLRDRVPGPDRVAVEQALELVEYACSTRTGVAIVPPPSA